MGNFMDLTGQRFGRLTVIGLAPKGKCRQTRWLCRCDCGTEKSVQAGHLRNGSIVSCGCYNSEMTSKRNHIYKTKHGDATHTHRDRLYRIYLQMKNRCLRKTHKYYYRYGERGIKICPEWLGEHGYENFKEWSYANGYKPNGDRKTMTLDRIDNDGDYCPDNCRWVTFKVQANNKSCNHRITIGNETHTISEWADIVGIDQRSISSRIYNGWSEEDAVMRPLRVW